jgi:hypothetical protein
MPNQAKASLAFMSLPLLMVIHLLATPSPAYGDKIAIRVAIGALLSMANAICCFAYFWKQPKPWFVILCGMINLAALMVTPLVTYMLLIEAYSTTV